MLRALRAADVYLSHHRFDAPTALVVSIADVVAELEPDVIVLVDAAHAPGMIPLDLDTLGASFVVGNCHKWMCAPKGAGFLYARQDRRAMTVPATVSHGWNMESPTGASRFHTLFDWTGTDDPSARLSIPAAIATMASLHDDGWQGIMTRNHDLVVEGRAVVCDALDVEDPVPADSIGSMATIPLPGVRDSETTGDLDPLTDRLRVEWAIEAPVFSWRDWPQRLLRISAQLYNSPGDYEKLADALVALV